MGLFSSIGKAISSTVSKVTTAVKSIMPVSKPAPAPAPAVSANKSGVTISTQPKSVLTTTKPPTVAQTIYKASNTALTVITHPIKSITNFSEAYKQTETQSLATNMALGGINTLAVVAPLSSVAKAGAVSVATKLIPATVKGKVIAVFAGVPIASALFQNPVGAVKTAGKVVKAQVDLGTVIANPNKDTALAFVKEHPYTTGAVGVATVGALGFGASSLISSVVNTQATKANTSAITDMMKGERGAPTEKEVEEEEGETKKEKKARLKAEKKAREESEKLGVSTTPLVQNFYMTPVTPEPAPSEELLGKPVGAVSKPTKKKYTKKKKKVKSRAKSYKKKAKKKKKAKVYKKKKARK